MLEFLIKQPRLILRRAINKVPKFHSQFLPFHQKFLFLAVQFSKPASLVVLKSHPLLHQPLVVGQQLQSNHFIALQSTLKAVTACYESAG